MTTSAPRKVKGACGICRRPTMGELCRYHEEGIRRLEKHYEVWRARTGVTWEAYIERISSNALAGDWVRESADYLLRNRVKGQRDPTA